MAVGLLAGASCVLDGSAEHVGQSTSAAETRVELQLLGGLPLVEGRLPNDQRAWFLIDTGAGEYTMLDPRLTKELGLAHELIDDPRMQFTHFAAKLPFLEVATLGRRNLTVYVVEGLSDRPALADLGVVVRGVLGTGFFRGQCLGIDWARHEFTADRPRIARARQIPIPLRIAPGGELHATVRINGITCEALIDTGSAETLVGKELADRLNVTYDRSALPLHRDTSVGVGALRAGTIDRLSLATEEIEKFPVLVIERRIPNADLLIGTDVLSRYGITLDLGQWPYLILDPRDGKAEPESHAPIPPPTAAEPIPPPAGDGR